MKGRFVVKCAYFIRFTLKKGKIMRAYNFCAGPAALPTAVLEKAQAELLDFTTKFGEDPTTETKCTKCRLPFNNHKRLDCIR